MENRVLKLVRATEAAPPAGGGALVPFLVGALVLGSAGLAGWLGADEARRKVEVTTLAEQALQLALERGSDDPSVRRTLIDLRRTVGRRPLESRTRVVYASLVLALSTNQDEMQLAGFHAGRAAELSPVTVSVVRAASLVLAHTGEIDRALELIRDMFGYDPNRAGALLAQVESLVLGVAVDRAIPDDPDAWMAWSMQVRQDRRREEADAWVDRTHARWPDYLPALTGVALRAFNRRDWRELEALLPVDRELPDDPASARLLIWRAHLEAHRGDTAAARKDVETALRLNDNPLVGLAAGALFEAIGDADRARLEWNRALHAAPREPDPARVGLLLRLARLEDRQGRPVVALRLWTELLEHTPDHAEARRRIDDLTGFRR